MQKKLFIKLLITISIILTINLVYGIPNLKIFNSINIIENVVNIENIENNYNNYNNNNKKNNNYDNHEYNLIILKNNYTINSTVIKHSMIYNPMLRHYTGEIMFLGDNNIYCKINVNPPKQTSSTYIQNYIYYEYNLGKIFELICNDDVCIFKTYYKYTYNFNYFMCNIKHQKYTKMINNEL